MYQSYPCSFECVNVRWRLVHILKIARNVTRDNGIIHVPIEFGSYPLTHLSHTFQMLVNLLFPFLLKSMALAFLDFYEYSYSITIFCK